MHWWVNGLRGWVEVRITGDGVEECWNRCASVGISFWRARQHRPGCWTVRVCPWERARLEGVAARCGCTAEITRRGGLPGLVWQVRYRYALLAGLVLSLCAVAVLGQFILSVEVSGNVNVPTGVILSRLRAYGVKPGAFGPGLDVRQISHSVILDLPALSWMAVNVHGTVAEVLVREGDPPPDLLDEDTPAHIVARYPGIITKIETTRGMQLVDTGSTVDAGDTLIASWVDFIEPEGYHGDMGGMLVRATGRVQARTWHTLRAAIPLTGDAKVFTGREMCRWSLEGWGRSMKFYPGGGIPYAKYDKITQYHTAVLPGGASLPLFLRCERCREYTTQPRPLDVDRAETVLRSALDQRLASIVRGEEVLRTDYQVKEENGLLTVTLLAECCQDIGMTVED